jgi:phytoene desaturase
MTKQQHLLIIGGGLAGLAAGSYARMNGWKTTVLEHNSELGGVCTSWQRQGYTIDGCIHWLTGGDFMRLYQELGIVPAVQLRTLQQFATYRDVQEGIEVVIGRDLDAFLKTLTTLSPGDARELQRLVAGAREFAAMKVPLDQPPELSSFLGQVQTLWSLRRQFGSLLHFRASIGEWVQRLESPTLRALFLRLAPEEAPALFLLMILGYLEKGYLSRPVGGTARFRDALVERYRALGGEVRLSSTVEEVLVRDQRAYGVRLADGTEFLGDLVVSTSSAPENVLHLLGGSYGADELKERMRRWKLFQPVALVSFGVSLPFADKPGMLLLDKLTPFKVGHWESRHLYVRVYNEPAEFAPSGHSVVQVMVPTEYDYWATRGEAYEAEKQVVSQQLLHLLEPSFPGINAHVKMVDVATPLTFWRSARSWRGAFEGWRPTPDGFFGHVPKVLPGLDGFYMAGQWVEPGGGVPTALMSGRQLVQVLCERNGKEFVYSSPVFPALEPSQVNPRAVL